MALLNNNPLFNGLSGKLGGLIFRQVGGKTIVSAAEAKGTRKKPSPKQQEHLDKFAAAVRYAIAQMQDPAAEALYATGVNGRLAGAYNVAIADYMKGPTITATDCSACHGQPGEPVRVWATDNFGVTAVSICLLTSDERELEAGPATIQPEGHWLYRTQHAYPTGTLLRIQATDRPGNLTTATHIL